MIDTIKAYRQFGFVKERDTSDGHEVGTCPFCKRPGHFYVNVARDNKPWDCKRCGKSGGFQKFLQTVAEEAIKNKTKVTELAFQRKLSDELLLGMQVGWINGSWVMPVFARDGKTVLNIKIYDGDSFMNTASCNSTMYGLWAMPDEYDTVYICEGEWDTLAMMELIDEDRTVALGVPGAGHVLKPDTVELLVGKSVRLLYDNDEAGQNGLKKTTAALAPVVSELKILKWPKGTSSGHDVRDVFTKDHKRDPKAARAWLDKHCEVVEAQKSNVQTPDVVGELVPVNEVYATFQKWLFLKNNVKYDQKNTDIYDVVFGTVFANRLPGDPLWMYIVAPPGGLKTEPLLSLMGGKLIEVVESVTAPALISGQGMNGTDPSLVPKLNGRLLVVKDWTIILGLPEHERKEILSILRGAFDGTCGRDFGNGIRRSYRSTFGILAAVTPVVEQYTEELAAVGERFLSWRNWLPEGYHERYELIKRALDNTTKEKEMRSEINTVAKRVLLAGIKEVPGCSEEDKMRIIKLSQWISIMRGTVTRDRYRKNVTHKPFTELGTRLSKEIYKLVLGISIFKGHPSVRPEAMRIARSVARSSVSVRYYDTLRALYKVGHDKGVAPDDIKKLVGLPGETIEMILENMKMLGAISRSVEEGKVVWRVQPDFHELTKELSIMVNL